MDERLQELIYQNQTLRLQVTALERRLDEHKSKLAVLSKMTDEWAKSYDNLLKDFISYRKENK